MSTENNIVNKLVKDQIGQLFISGINGLTLSANEQEFIANKNLGGVIYFAKNFDHPIQLAELSNAIQKEREEFPLFISIDHEGGRVHRLGDFFTHFPPMQKVGKIDSPKVTFEVFEVMAKELQSVGINYSFAPVCDINLNKQNKVIGDRAFSSDVNVVNSMVTAAVRGLQNTGVLACAKHFPGHGRTLLDSHFDLPELETTVEQLEELELLPFKKASKSRVESIMMSHINYKCFDDKLPVSLSKKAHEFLRKELKFNGLIVTDDMEMEAITKNYSIEDACLKAFLAGSDIMIIRNFSQTLGVYEHFIKAYETGLISTNRINESLDRIKKVKAQYLSEYKPIDVTMVAASLKTDQSALVLNCVQ